METVRVMIMVVADMVQVWERDGDAQSWREGVSMKIHSLHMFN